MAEGLALPDGTGVSVPDDIEDEVADFNRMMARAATGDSGPEPEVPAPPKRADTTDPGYTPNVRKPRGRPPKAERARTTDKIPAAAQDKAVKAVKAQTDAERREGVKGLVQIASGICLVLDQRTKHEDVSFKADAYTLAASADAVAEAVAQTAAQNEGFARALDKITAAGPYAALVGVMVSVGAQIAANHGVKAAQAMGARDPREVVAAFEAA